MNAMLDLILDAIAEFSHQECPYCQAYISPDRHLDEGEVSRWLKDKLNSDLVDLIYAELMKRRIVRIEQQRKSI